MGQDSAPTSPHTPSGNPIKKVLSLTSLQSKDVAYGTLPEGDAYTQLEEGAEKGERQRRDTLNTDDSEVSVTGLSTTGTNWWDKGTTTTFQLRNVKDTPPLLRYPFIYDGYRVNFTFPLAVQSIFRLHNETWNIWTHLVAAVLYVCLAIYTVVYLHQYDMEGKSGDFDPLWVHVLMFMIYCVCVTISWTCSAIFHTCSCMSKAMCYTVGAGDYIGIFVNIAGCAVPATFYGFDCDRPFQMVYCVGIASACLVCCLLVVSPKWHIAEGPWVRLRQVIYMMMVLSCFIPAVHYCLQIKNWHPQITQLFLRLGGLLALECLAFFFYVTKIPERWVPGRLAVWGTSHQIFHIILVIASLEHYLTLIEMFTFQSKMPCSARTWMR